LFLDLRLLIPASGGPHSRPSEISNFDQAHKLDEDNERMPPVRAPSIKGRRASKGSTVELFRKLTV
jgi:hypothetical protein